MEQVWKGVQPHKKVVVQIMLRDAKAEVCAEFEKVCQTEKSLKRMVKEMHNVFDKLEENVAQILKA
jgi:hypothetical protein